MKKHVSTVYVRTEIMEELKMRTNGERERKTYILNWRLLCKRNNHSHTVSRWLGSTLTVCQCKTVPLH